ncbi:MAG: hypothetical protein ACXW2U_02310 [Telluria sp.]
MKPDGGATAPMQNAEQALHFAWGDSPGWCSSPEAASALAASMLWGWWSAAFGAP